MLTAELLCSTIPFHFCCAVCILVQFLNSIPFHLLFIMWLRLLGWYQMQKGHHAIKGLRELVEHNIHTYYEFLLEMKMVYSRNGYQDSMSGHTWRDLLRRVLFVPYGSYLANKTWDDFELSSFNENSSEESTLWLAWQSVNSK